MSLGALGSAPAATRVLATSAPPPNAAKWSAVWPEGPFLRMSAPRVRRAATHLTRPCTREEGGVNPLMFWGGSGPCFRHSGVFGQPLSPGSKRDQCLKVRRYPNCALLGWVPTNASQNANIFTDFTNSQNQFSEISTSPYIITGLIKTSPTRHQYW